MICYECGNILSDEERHYYADRCEKCEGVWHDRIEAWRHGGADSEIDAALNNKPTLQ